jgi:RNA polymerase sigma-70 factor, ECF subfamily
MLPATLWAVSHPASSRADLDRIVRTEMPRVERLLLRILGPRQDLEDLVQTVFLELVRAYPQFRGDSSVSTFIGGITVRIAKRAMRRSAFQRLRALFSSETEASSGNPEHKHRDTERLRRVQKALEQISADKRIAFCLWALSGLEPAHVAQLTGASLSAVRSRIFYAQKELRALAAQDPWLAEALSEVSP